MLQTIAYFQTFVAERDLRYKYLHKCIEVMHQNRVCQNCMKEKLKNIYKIKKKRCFYDGREALKLNPNHVDALEKVAEPPTYYQTISNTGYDAERWTQGFPSSSSSS